MLLVAKHFEGCFQRPQAQLYALINISQFAVIIVHTWEILRAL